MKWKRFTCRDRRRRKLSVHEEGESLPFLRLHNFIAELYKLYGKRKSLNSLDRCQNLLLYACIHDTFNYHKNNNSHL